MNINKKDNLFYELIYLPKSKLRQLFKHLFREGFDDKQIDIIESELFKIKYKNKYTHASSWIEKKLTKTPELTPYKVALTYISVTSGNRRLLPYYIKLAQRIKDRLRKRKEKRLPKTD